MLSLRLPTATSETLRHTTKTYDVDDELASMSGTSDITGEEVQYVERPGEDRASTEVRGRDRNPNKARPRALSPTPANERQRAISPSQPAETRARPAAGMKPEGEDNFFCNVVSFDTLSRFAPIVGTQFLGGFFSIIFALLYVNVELNTEYRVSRLSLAVWFDCSCVTLCPVSHGRPHSTR